jgi:Transposase Tn5 dimerisation domain
MHTLTMAGRADPAMSCEVVCEPRAWHTLETMPHHGHPPPTPPPLRERGRSLAQLGGFCARTRDGEPGLNAIWQGEQRLHEFSCALQTYRTVHAGERHVYC